MSRTRRAAPRSLIPAAAVAPKLACALAFSLGTGSALAAAEPNVLLQQAAQRLQLTEVRIVDKGVHMPDLHGRLPGGALVEVDVRRDGSIEEVDSKDGRGFDPADVAMLLHPDMLTGAPWGPAARFHKVELDDDARIEIEGIDDRSRRFDAKFAQGGRLLEFEYDD